MTIDHIWDSPQRIVEDGKEASNSVWFPGDKRHDWERPCFDGYKTVVLGDSQLKFFGRNKQTLPGYNITSYSGCDVSLLFWNQGKELLLDARAYVHSAVSNSHRSIHKWESFHSKDKSRQVQERNGKKEYATEPELPALPGELYEKIHGETDPRNRAK